MIDDIPVLEGKNFELFLSMTEILPPDEQGFACWVWRPELPHGWMLGKTNDYGFFRGVGGIKGFCTQLAWVKFVGPIPVNPATGRRMPLDHHCFRTYCWNPTHLTPKTQSENVLGQRPRKPRKVRTSCRKGHEYTERSTRFSPLGFRYCGICTGEVPEEVAQEAI